LRHLPDLTLDHVLHRQWPGGVFQLPVPVGHESARQWARDARAAIEAERARWAGFRPAPEARLAIDLAVRDTPAAGLDLDNLAHRVLDAFEETYCDGRRAWWCAIAPTARRATVRTCVYRSSRRPR
jgi:hypothetical protein